MEIKQILSEERNIWPDKLSLSEIIIRLGVVYGDICRYERNAPKDVDLHTREELVKEFGNLITSAIRWCDDLGLNPEECIEKALEAQRKFPK
jgi:hypothetical protein